MSYPRPIPAIMGDIVTKVSTAILADLQVLDSNIEAINYQYGHLSEIIETMQQYERSPEHKSKKYPLIALFLDIPEYYGNSGNYPGSCTLHMAICFSTGLTLKAEERYNTTIKPLLIPIYNELLKQIDECREFVTGSATHLEHEMTERPYWGRGGLGDTAGNVFADAVDAIEINNLKLTIHFPNCS